jgi:DNA topoisomerase 2-associated protein PAT1
LFLSRAELLRSAPPLESHEQTESTLPSHESILRWQGVFNQLFHYLSSDFPSLFPSTRLAGALSSGSGLPPQAVTDSLEMNQKYMRPGIDLEDEPVWQLMAALAVSTDSDGQQTLVGGLRGKVLENVIAVSKKSVSDEIGAFKIVCLHFIFFFCFVFLCCALVLDHLLMKIIFLCKFQRNVNLMLHALGLDASMIKL